MFSYIIWDIKIRIKIGGKNVAEKNFNAGGRLW